jgi:hypothetical protein
MSPSLRADLLQAFERLPDDSIALPKMTAAVLDVSERTLRRSPPIPRVQITSQRFGYRVGNIRKLVRGELVAQVAQ